MPITPARTEPYSRQEIREMYYDQGLSIGQIKSRVLRMNRMGVADVREIIFGRSY